MNLIRNLIIAHRGESYDAPENTMASIKLAWDRGAEAVEIDIQLTKDNKIVVIHDTNTKRTGIRAKKVNKQTLDELRELDVGSFKNAKWMGEKIPTLSEVFCTVPDNKKIIVEIKCGKEIISHFKEEIQKSGLKPEQIEIIGFDFQTVVKAKEELPDHLVMLLADLDYSMLTRILSPSVDSLISRSQKNNLDGLDAWAGKILNEEFINKVKSAGLKLYVWTVNDAVKAEQLFAMGVDGITTDRAEWLKQKLSS